jgi:hypothetical protein
MFVAFIFKSNIVSAKIEMKLESRGELGEAQWEDGTGKYSNEEENWFFR